MQSTRYIDKEKVLQFQELVKAFDLRFIGNPIYTGEKALVTIDGNGLPMEQCNQFFAAWNRVNTPIREIPKKTKLQKLTKKLKGWF
jgi:hypothetical protein